MKDFVTFEMAKRLKEKGFPQRPDYFNYSSYYDWDGLRKIHSLSNASVWFDPNIDRENIYFAPTISQVLKWLREKYIDIAAYPIFTYEPNLNRIYETEIHTPQLNKSVKLGYYRTWEEAINEGIYYAITELKLNKI